MPPKTPSFARSSSAATIDPQEAAALLNTYRQNPAYFCQSVLGWDPWRMQSDILNSLAKPRARVGAKAAHAVGKCLRGKTSILMYNGKVKYIEDVIIGDQLMGPDSTPRTVLSTTRGRGEMYRIVPTKGEPFVCNGDHLLTLRKCGSPTNSKSKRVPNGSVVDISVDDYLASSKEFKTRWKLFRTGVEYPKKNVPLDPYFVGLWLGDGTANSTQITTADSEIVTWLETYANALGVRLSIDLPYPGRSCASYRMVGDPAKTTKRRGCNLVQTHLDALDLRNNKHIPHVYLANDRETRLRLLAGLIDSDGHLCNGGGATYEITQKSERLAKDILTLARSLGFAATSRVKLATIKHRGVETPVHRIIISGDVDEIPVLLPRKRATKIAREKNVLTVGFRVEPVGEDDYYGFSLDGDGRFLLGDFTVTHNSNLAAMAVFWRVATGGIAITTAPTWTQVAKVLWAEIHKTYGKYQHILGGELLSTEWRMSPNCYAMGLSTNEGVRFQGWHGDILIILDEAPGVKPDIWEAIEGIRSGGDVTILALGNPTTTGNPFHAAFLTEGQNTGWDLFSIPAFVTPNFAAFPTIESIEQAAETNDPRLDNVPRPYLIQPRWVLEKYREWGPDSPMYQSRVLANFPDQSADALIPLSWIMNAAVRRIEPTDNSYVAGVDVAGGGEAETVVYVRQGPTIVGLRPWTQPDPREEVIAYLSDWQERGRLKVNVDSIGVGHYFYQDLRAAGFDVTPVNVGTPPQAQSTAIVFPGQKPPKPEELGKYTNLKAQLYWRLREQLQNGQVAGLVDTQTQNQLATILYKQLENGKIAIETKDSMRARGLESPDRAEALMLCFATIQPATGNFVPVLAFDATEGWGMNDDPFGLGVPSLLGGMGIL
jgi:hypothetical protein